MKTLRAWIIRLSGFFTQKRQDREFAEEIESHLAMHIQDNLHSGMSPEEARRNALIKLGGVDKVFEEHRDRRGFRWLIELQRNIHYALRVLWKQKALSVIVIGLLAVACAANAAIFSVYNFLYLRSLPYPHGERLVAIDSAALCAHPEENRSFDAVGFYNPDYRNYSRQGAAGTVNILNVTWSFASVLQIQPVIGRGFFEKEDCPGEPKIVMLSYRFWQREFGGNPAAVGQTLKLDGEVHTVAGVLPENADFPADFVKSDLWVLFQRSRDDVAVWYPQGIGRLKERVTLEQARADAARIHRITIETRPANEKIPLPRLQYFRESIFGKASLVTTVLLFAAGILLLIVCFNITGMMLARSEYRAQEMGIRTALGASRSGIIRQLLTESLLLTIPGVLLGLLFGQMILKLTALKIDAPSWVRLTPDIRLLAFCMALTGAATVLFGLAPALHATRANVQRSLHESSSRSSASGVSRRGLKLLVTGELALAVMMLVGAGLLLRAWQKMLAVDPGFRAENIFTFNLKLPTSSFKDEDGSLHLDRPARFFDRFIERLRQLPGVTAVSGSNVLPLGRATNEVLLDIEGVPSRPDDRPDPILVRWVFPEYFKSLAIPLLSGRDFNEEDGRTKDSYVAIVDQSFARRYWPGADPIGKQIRMRAQYFGREHWGTMGDLDQWMTVVGLTRDALHSGLDQAMQPGIYIPHKMWRSTQMYIIVRSAGASPGLLGSIRSQLHAMNPDVGIFDPRTMTEVVHQSTLLRRVLLIVMTLFAVAALLIATAGVYGVVSYNVSRRTHEIGIRMALGATRGQVLGMVVGGGARLVIAGAAFGMAGAIVSSRAMQSMLFGITPFDIPTYIITGAVLGVVVAAATLLPARRAASIEPMRALRSE